MTRFECPACGAKIKANQDVRGRTIECPGCHEKTTVAGQPEEVQAAVNTMATPRAPNLSPLPPIPVIDVLATPEMSPVILAKEVPFNLPPLVGGESKSVFQPPHLIRESRWPWRTIAGFSIMSALLPIVWGAASMVAEHRGRIAGHESGMETAAILLAERERNDPTIVRLGLLEARETQREAVEDQKKIESKNRNYLYGIAELAVAEVSLAHDVQHEIIWLRDQYKIHKKSYGWIIEGAMISTVARGDGNSDVHFFGVELLDRKGYVMARAVNSGNWRYEWSNEDQKLLGKGRLEREKGQSFLRFSYE